MEPRHSYNPYAPPRADGDGFDTGPSLDGDLATRWQRLGAAMLDGMLSSVAIAPGFLGTTRAAVAQNGKDKNPFFLYTNSGKWGVVAAALSLGLLAVQWYLIATRGQSLGKIVAKARIVMVDGSRAEFGRIIGLRTWSVWLLSLAAAAIPGLAILISIDFLMVFRKDRRCLHDLVAGTKVIAVRKAD